MREGMKKSLKVKNIGLSVLAISAITYGNVASAVHTHYHHSHPHLHPAMEIKAPSWASVSGIFANVDTKDLGKITGLEAFDGIKVRGWLDSNYDYNFNNPDRAIVDANQNASIVKGRDVSIEGRTFDIHHNSFQFSLAEIEIEKVAEYDGFGFKLDLALGETQDILVDTIRGGLGENNPNSSVNSFDKTVQHASISYVAPLGRGLRVDFGKFVSHIGAETIESIKNWNYSHAYYYTYGIPFQNVGFRANYAWSDTLSTDFYVLNGWNVTVDNNTGKTFGPSVSWAPETWLSVTANYLVGPEQNNNNANLRHLLDAQLALGPFDEWTFLFNLNAGFEKNALVKKTQNAHWKGLTAYVRYQYDDRFIPCFRMEYYNDRNGLTTNVAQRVFAYTMTFNTILSDSVQPSGSSLMIRPELRYDNSNKNFYSKKNTFRAVSDQLTVGVGVTWFF